MPVFHVVLHAHGVEQADVLEGTGHAGPVHLSGGHVVGVLPVQKDGAVRRLIHLREQVEDRRLARAVGADESRDLRAADGEVEVLHGLQAAELNAQVDALQDGAFCQCPVPGSCSWTDGNQFRSPCQTTSFFFFLPQNLRRPRTALKVSLLVASITRMRTMA